MFCPFQWQVSQTWVGGQGEPYSFILKFAKPLSVDIVELALGSYILIHGQNDLIYDKLIYYVLLHLKCD